MPYVDHTVVGNIFRSLRGRFGNAFMDKFRSGKAVPEGQQNAGRDTGLLEAIDVWVYELRQLSDKDIQHGLSCRFKYPPSADEFVHACCTREITPPTPTGDLQSLPAPTLTREQAEKHLSRLGGAVKSLSSGNDRLRLDWAHKIAEESANGTYCGGLMGKRLAADAFYDSRNPVPAALLPFLSKNRAEEQAA
ncbi:hypothetical protein [Aquitalea pelogenes]|uniref:hypothetical protein n=1 Tax=Aquitalea pelogenes TaxID=1293573 RepID=UPI0035B32876